MGNELQLLVESIPAHVVVTTPSGDVETVRTFLSEVVAHTDQIG